MTSFDPHTERLFLDGALRTLRDFGIHPSKAEAAYKLLEDIHARAFEQGQKDGYEEATAYYKAEIKRVFS